MSRVSQMVAVWTFPWLAVSMTLLTFIQISFPALSHFVSLFLPSLLVNYLFQLSSFIKCCVGLSLRVMEATQLHTLLFVYELNNRCSVTCHQWLWREQCNWSPIMMCICYLHSDVWTEELAAKFVHYAITHS